MLRAAERQEGNSCRATGQFSLVDLLKTVAIVLMLIDHAGAFLVRDPETAFWMRIVGRASFPIWAILLGWLAGKTVPWRIFIFGAALSALTSVLHGDIFLNVLIGFFLVRVILSSGSARNLVAGQCAASVLILAAGLSAPMTSDFIEYGTLSFAFALWGHSLRTLPSAVAPTISIGLVMSLYAAWQGIGLPSAPDLRIEDLPMYLIVVEMALVMGGCGALKLAGQHRFRISSWSAAVLRWLGRHSLEIYVVHLAVLLTLALIR